MSTTTKASCCGRTRCVRLTQIIMELRDRINALLSERSAPVTQMSFVQQDDGLIYKLRSTIADRETEISDLRNELRRRQTVDVVREPPKVVRVTEPNLKEVRYEKDPYLIEQNARLSKELEQALVVCSDQLEEQNAKNDLAEKIKEIQRLLDLIAQLKAAPPRVVTREVVKTQHVSAPTRIGDRAERLFDLYKKNNDLMAKQLKLNMLYYFKLYMKYRRLAERQSSST